MRATANVTGPTAVPGSLAKAALVIVNPIELRFGHIRQGTLGRSFEMFVSFLLMLNMGAG
jgi:hypothetical protein